MNGKPPGFQEDFDPLHGYTMAIYAAFNGKTE